MSSKAFPPPYEQGDRWDAEAANELRDAAIEASRIVAGPGILVQESSGGNVVISTTQEEQVATERKFLGHTTAIALQSGHAARWNYTFAQVELTPTGYQVVSGGTTGTAINIIELAHIAEPSSETPFYVWGVDVHGENYPAGFRPRPVGGGGTSGTHKVNQPVEITERTDTEGNTVYTFHGWGSHDGGCSA